ncbi:MAG: PqqD family protein [bacterium]
MDKYKLERIYAKSCDLVEREIEGEIIIVPLTSGIGDLEDELFSLNKVGRDVWARIDGKKPVRAIVEELFEIYEQDRERLTADVLGFLEELEERKLVVEEVPCRIT